MSVYAYKGSDLCCHKDCVLFVSCKDSSESEWVNIELEYSRELGKQVYCIDFTDSTENQCNVLKFDTELELVDWNVPSLNRN